MGVSVTAYSDADLAAGRLITDAVTVLIVSRKFTLSPPAPATVSAVRDYIAAGGSYIGEYDGAAWVFTAFQAGQPIIGQLQPSLGIFEGVIAGGGALLPIGQSRTYVSDPMDPLVQGVPASFLMQSHSAFAVSGLNSDWLHASATFTSVGYQGLVPAGSYPALLSGRCGSGRVVLFTMNHFQVILDPNTDELSPVATLLRNALNWSVGN
jgi:hypothetical protein